MYLKSGFGDFLSLKRVAPPKAEKNKRTKKTIAEKLLKKPESTNETRSQILIRDKTPGGVSWTTEDVAEEDGVDQAVPDHPELKSCGNGLAFLTVTKSTFRVTEGFFLPRKMLGRQPQMLNRSKV